MPTAHLLTDGIYFGEGPRWHDDRIFFSDFYDHLVKRGCTLPGGVSFEPNELRGDGSRETFRGPYFSAFSVLARRDEHP